MSTIAAQLAQWYSLLAPEAEIKKKHVLCEVEVDAGPSPRTSSAVI